MVYRIEVTPHDVMASRFAISPLIETNHALWILSGAREASGWLAWADRMREPYEKLLRTQPGLAPLVWLFRERHYNADFPAPPPSGVNTPFETELMVVRATPVTQAHEEIAKNLEGMPRPPEPIRDVLFSPDVVRLFAEALAAIWEEIVSPAWPRFHTILERDVVQRAGRLATYGWAAALDDLNPQIRWHPDGVIEVLGRGADETHRLNGRGLLFVPSVFFFSGVGSYLEDSWPYAISYPARGTGIPPETADGLAGLIGRTRTRLLLELAAPATTTQLVTLLGLGLGTVGGHISALRKAGLITGNRTGRTVLYHRTPLGDSLVNHSVALDVSR
ncbi:winged helix-turn-helix domain-containing protein [Streptosporangium amethystogenes]|uniref:winged helix-turn-helix domain-containing protein n=1 Tax=Streptosporangium amethystogenes TaxID=2002 RepID=UPI00378928B2